MIYTPWHDNTVPRVIAPTAHRELVWQHGPCTWAMALGRWVMADGYAYALWQVAAARMTGSKPLSGRCNLSLDRGDFNR